MENFFTQISNLLVIPPGNLLYHLVIAFSIGIALQASLSQSNQPGSSFSRRTILGTSILLSLQIILFVISGLGWQSLINPQGILPPVDRAAAALSVIWIAWLWLFPKPSRVADTLTILFNLVIVIALAFSLALWAPESTTGFNSSGLEIAWETATLFILLTAGTLIVTQRPAGWPIGLGMMAILFIGAIFQIFVFIPGDYPGFSRLAQLAAFPLLFSITQRFSVSSQAMVKAPDGSLPDAKTEKPQVKERRRYSADPKTVHAFLSLAIEENPKNMVATVTRAIGQAMLSDLCLLITSPDNSGRISILGGYDLIREESLEGCNLDRGDIPMLASAIQKGRPLRLAANHDTSPDIKTLYEVIGLSNPGNLLAVPLPGKNQTTLGGIVLLSPYSNRVWSTDDQTYLTNAAEQLGHILYRPLPAILQSTISPADQASEVERLKNELDSSHQQVERMEKVQKDLTEQLVALQQRTSSASQNETMQALLAVQEEAQDLIGQLQDENETLRMALKEAPGSGAASTGQIKSDNLADIHHLEDELHQALAQAAQLQNKLAISNSRIMDLEKRIASPDLAQNTNQPPAATVEENNTAIMMVIQELHRPVSGMVIQVDNLIQTASNGNKDNSLKTYARLKTSVERILGLLDDLVEIIARPNNSVELHPEDIDVLGLIDQVIAATTVEFRDKNLSLQVDLPEKLPELNADLQSTQKTLVLLLHNAGEITPAGGAIRLKVRLQGESLEDQFMLFQVTDSGGGINSTDLPRLFSRFENEGEQSIAGVGAARSITESRDLVEAQNGRIWVDTDPGKSTTLSFLLPVQQSNVMKDIIDE